MSVHEKIAGIEGRGEKVAQIGRAMRRAFDDQREAACALFRAIADAVPDDAFALAATFVPDAPRGVRGIQVHGRLWLTTERVWFAWQAASSQLAPVSDAELVDAHCDPGGTADLLGERLERHIRGAATKRIDEAERAAARLRAVALLLRGRS